MTTTRVRLTAESSAGGTYQVWLLGDPTLAGLHGVAVVPRSITGKQRLDTTGKALVDLSPNVELDPLGTVYRCDFRKTGASVSEQLFFTVPVVAVTAPVTVVDAASYEVDAPTGLTYVDTGGEFATVGASETGGTL